MDIREKETILRFVFCVFSLLVVSLGSGYVHAIPVVKIIQNSQYDSPGIVPAQIKESSKSILPPSQFLLSEAQEQWALLSYVVNTSGTAESIEVLHSSNNSLSAPAQWALAYLQNLTFKPASSSGKPVDSAQVLFVASGSQEEGFRKSSLSKDFVGQYKKIRRLYADQQFDQAKKELETLQQLPVSSLSEQATAAWLQAMYFYYKNDWVAYKNNLEVAGHLKQYLPRKLAYKTGHNLFEWYKYRKRYMDALAVLPQLQTSSSGATASNTLNTMKNDVLSLIENEKFIDINTTLPESGVWLHRLTRSSIRLSARDGGIKRAELRCINNWQPLDVQKALNFIIPDSAEACTLLVVGKPGTTIDLVEQGKSHYRTAHQDMNS